MKYLVFTSGHNVGFQESANKASADQYVGTTAIAASIRRGCETGEGSRFDVEYSKGHEHGQPKCPIGKKYFVPPDERTRVFPRDQIYLDVGAKNEAEVRAMGISPGDPVVPDSPFMVLNKTDNYLAKAWDDRGTVSIDRGSSHYVAEP